MTEDDFLTEEREPLSRTIRSVEQITEMSTDELETSFAAHEAEIVFLVGAIEAGRVLNPVRARQAERVLRLHKAWIEREMKVRKHAEEHAASKLAKQAKAQAHQKLSEKVQAEKSARIAASNEENIRQIAVFKAVALEVLGAAQYLDLWNKVRQRMEAGTVRTEAREPQ